MVDRKGRDAGFETALEIELGREGAPDIAARLFGVDAVESKTSRRVERFLMAALLVLATGLVVFLAFASTGASTQEAGEQDPRRTHRIWHRNAYAPVDVETALKDARRATAVRARHVLVADPVGSAWIRVQEHPLEALGALFGQGPVEPEIRGDGKQLRTWQDGLREALKSDAEPAPAYVSAPFELVFDVPDNGELVWVVGVDDDGETEWLHCQGLPWTWRCGVAEWLYASLEDLTSDVLQEAIASRGIALGSEGLAALPADAKRLRLYGIGPDDVAGIARFDAVSSLDLRGSPRLLDVAALRELARVAAPRSLILPDEGLDAAHLEALLPMPVEELFVGDPYAVLTRTMRPIERDLPFADGEAAVLARFGKLRELSIPNCSISDEGVARLAVLPLRRLMLGSTAIDGSGFEAFLRSPTCVLQRLVLRGTGSLKPESFHTWARMESLEHLGFMGCLLPNPAPMPPAEVERRALASLTIDTSFFQRSLPDGLPAILDRYASCRKLCIGLLNGQVAELAELELPIPVERIEVLVGTADQIEATREALAGFAARHPDLRLSVDSW